MKKAAHVAGRTAPRSPDSFCPMQASNAALSDAAYSAQLLQMSLDRLNKEPGLLVEEQRRIEAGLQATAHTHYGAFIQTAGCMRTIDTELSSVLEHLELLLQVRMQARAQPACPLQSPVWLPCC